MPLREIVLLAAAALRAGEEKTVEEFEEAFRKFGGFPQAIMTASGRTSFRILLESLSLPEGAEIIFPAYTFHPMPVTAAECGLVPVFADVDPDTWNMDPESLRERITPRTRVVVPTHLYGVPADMEKINEIARDAGLFVIEDCAHALGATCRGRQVGNWGDAAVFTFAMSKNLPCWGGGALVLRDLPAAERLRKLSRGSPPPSNRVLLRRQFPNMISMLATHPVFFPWTLYPALRAADRFKSDIFDRRFLEEVVPPRRPLRKVNGKQSAVSGKRSVFMTPLQAAAGLRQLRRLPGLLERQVRNARRLRESLAGCAELQLQEEPPGSAASFLYVRARVDEPAAARRRLRRLGVDTKADDMRDCSALSIFPDRPACPNARRLGGNCIELPCGPYYSAGRIDDIAHRVLAALK